MKRSTLAAGVFAAALLAGAAGTRAADLDYGRVPTDRYSEAYEDPRYRDLFAPEPPRRYSAAPYNQPRYEPGYNQGYNQGYNPGHPVPPGNVYRDNAPYRYGQNGCLPREALRERLLSEGWGNFQDLELRGEVARINARRPNGDLYSLKVDRCSGEIVNSRLIQRGGLGPYAYEDGPRRPYY